MRKNIFTCTVVAIQCMLLICFTILIVNNLPRSWELKDSLYILNSNNTQSNMQPMQPIKSFVTYQPFNNNNINDSYITAALENLHVSFNSLQETEKNMQFDIIKSNSNLLYYKIYNKSEIWEVAVCYPKEASPRIAVVSKEAVQ